MKPLIIVAIGLMAVAASNASAAIPITFASPSDDRWHYPFNSTPGNRSSGSVFGSTGDLGPGGMPRFNDRDGIVLLAWDTTNQVTPGQGSGAYHVKSVKITITHIGGAAWTPDLSADEWYTYDFNADGVVNADGFPRGHPMDTDGESDDVDPGRPFELFGAGFDPDSILFDELSWTESSFFTGWNQQPNPVARNPFPFVYQDGTLDQLHVEDNVKGLHNDGLPVPVTQFTPVPWATGTPIGYVPDATPDPFDMEFDLDLELSCGEVRNYFARQLDNGRVILVLTSLFETTQQPGGGFPLFFLNNPLGNPHPAVLEITLSDHPRGDMDGDDDVDADDLNEFIQVLLDPAGSTPQQLERADLDCNGLADGEDVAPFTRVYLGGC